MAENSLPTLDAPRTLSEEPLYNLESTVRSQFNRVVLLEGDDEKATVVAQDQKKQTKIGSTNVEFICGLIVGALGGRGDAPGGAAIWTAENATKMKHLAEYTILAVPKSRGGTIEATVGDFVDIVKSRAKVLSMSLKKHPVPKRAKDTTIGDEDEEVEVWL
jgi:hypothetical protein